MNSQLLAVKAVSLVAVLAMTACAGTGTLITSPEVRLTSVEMTSADFHRQKFVLGFHVSNPNAFPLPVKSVAYRVRLGDQPFVSGETQGGFTVPSNGDSSFAISVEVDLLRTTTKLAGFIPGNIQRDLTYELSGSLAVDIPFAKPLQFSHSDRIDMLAAEF
jgi:LEA14-like dessication related protein